MTIVSNDLKWDMNTDKLIKSANARMQLLHKMSNFGAPLNDMKEVYVLFVRSLLEQTSELWHSSLTQDNIEDLERVQKSAVKIMIKNKYTNYNNALNMLQIDTLEHRREQLSLQIAQKSTKHPKLQHMFPLNTKNHTMETRETEKYHVQFANTTRLQNSAIIYMQRLLNENETKIFENL